MSNYEANSYEDKWDNPRYVAAVNARINANARKTFFKNNPDLEGWFHDYYNGAVKDSEFNKSLIHSIETYGKLTPNQATALRNSITKYAELRAEWAHKREAEKGNSQFISEKGKRVELTLTVLAVVDLYSDFGWAGLYICKDDLGNKVIYKGAGHFFNKGETAKVVATIKAHEFREDEKQTVINRPKVLEVIKANEQ